MWRVLPLVFLVAAYSGAWDGRASQSRDSELITLGSPPWFVSQTARRKDTCYSIGNLYMESGHLNLLSYLKCHNCHWLFNYVFISTGAQVPAFKFLCWKPAPSEWPCILSLWLEKKKQQQMAFQVFQITQTAITLRILLKPQDSLGFKDVFPVFSVVKRTLLPRNNSDFMSELSISWNSQGEWTLLLWYREKCMRNQQQESLWVSGYRQSCLGRYLVAKINKPGF